jgi:hypothetical protein
MVSQKVVTPVKTGVQRDFNLLILLDTGFRRYDGKVDFPTFCEFISIETRPSLKWGAGSASISIAFSPEAQVCI